MTTIYNKSLSTDFDGNLATTQLFNEIETDPGISPTCVTISNVGDNVSIIFTTALSGGEETTLDGLITAHTPNTHPTVNRQEQLMLKSSKYKSFKYSRAATYIFRPSDETLINIEIISSKQSSITSYDMRVINLTNNSIIATKNFTNDIEQINNLGVLANIPTEESILEVSVRKNGGSKKTIVNVESIVLYFS